MSTRANAERYKWTTSGFEPTALSTGVVPQQRGGLLDLIGTLTNASKLEEVGAGDYKPANPFWDHLLTNAQGARKAEALNNVRAQLEQGLKLKQLEHQLAVEMENLKTGNAIKEKRKDAKFQTRKERAAAEEARKTLSHASNIKLGADRGIFSSGIADAASRLNPINTRNAVASSLNEGLLTEATGQRMRGQRSGLASGLEPALDAGLSARLMGSAPDAFSKMVVSAPEGGATMFPSPNNLLGGLGMFTGPQMDQSATQTEGGISIGPDGRPVFTPGSQQSLRTWKPPTYFSPVDALKRAEAERAAETEYQRLQREAGNPSAAEVPAMPQLEVLKGLPGLGGGATNDFTPLDIAALVQQFTNTPAPALSNGISARPGLIGNMSTNIPKAAIDLSSPAIRNLPANSLTALLNAFNVFTGNPNRGEYK